MRHLLTSASKLAFLFITGAVCYGFLSGVLTEASFKELALICFTYYFTHKQGSGDGEAGTK